MEEFQMVKCIGGWKLKKLLTWQGSLQQLLMNYESFESTFTEYRTSTGKLDDYGKKISESEILVGMDCTETYGYSQIRWCRMHSDKYTMISLYTMEVYCLASCESKLCGHLQCTVLCAIHIGMHTHTLYTVYTHTLYTHTHCTQW